MDRLVKGRERIDPDRFWNENCRQDPKSIDEATRRHYAKKIYARPGAMHAAFEQFATFQHAATQADNKEFQARGKLTMPILALGAEKTHTRPDNSGSRG